MVMFVSLVEPLTRVVEWSCVLTTSGTVSVARCGANLRPSWSVDNWDTLLMVPYYCSGAHWIVIPTKPVPITDYSLRVYVNLTYPYPSGGGGGGGPVNWPGGTEFVRDHISCGQGHMGYSVLN